MKLHELLAVETNLENQAGKCRTDLAATFEKKRHLFEEKRVTFTPNGEGGLVQTELQSDIQTTVKKELEWLADHIVKSLDASYQVAETNTAARANIELEDGTVLAKDIPATSLLELEKRVTEIAELTKAIPTLDPAKGFTKDDARGVGYYSAREVIKTRTRKTKRVIVKYEATKEHPAQTELIDEDQPTGTLREMEWSGLITPGEKAELINRIEMVSRAVRRARSRANDAEVDKSKKLGAALLNYILQR